MDIDNSAKECLREYILNRRTYADIAKDYSKAEETVRQKVKKETKLLTKGLRTEASTETKISPIFPG